jgi:hypothetical protein
MIVTLVRAMHKCNSLWAHAEIVVVCLSMMPNAGFDAPLGLRMELKLGPQ